MPFNNYAPQYIFKGLVQSDTAPSNNNDLVRKQDVSGLSFISSIAAGSSSYLSVDASGELSVDSLLISDVTVDNSQTSLANFIANESALAAALKKGDFLVLTAATGGAETYIVSGLNGSTAGNYTQVESGLTSAEIVAKLTGGTGITIAANGTIATTITQYTDSNARASLSSGTGISYNNSTGAISSTITQYSDANARASISATGNISYNNSTGVISTTLTQYADSNARASLSAGTGISYDNSTGVIGCSITQYADSNARASISATGNISYNSSTGVISTTLTQYADSNARASVSGGDGLTYNSSTGVFAVDTGGGLVIDGGDQSLTVNNDYFRKVFTGQDFVANTGKTINHSLGQKYVHVSVYDSSEQLLHAQVVLTDADNLSITMSDGLTGATVVVSI